MKLLLDMYKEVAKESRDVSEVKREDIDIMLSEITIPPVIAKRVRLA